MSMGPGWAYTTPYLEQLFVDTYGFEYKPRAGDVVVDIGAGLGEEVIVVAQLVGQMGKVYALEANPTTFAGLQFMCEQNKFAWVRALHEAIYNSDTKVTIEDDSENYLTNTINTSSAGYEVNAITLDSLVGREGITRIDFMKVNIEGAEQFLIEGMNKSVGMIHHMCISCHDFRHAYHNHGEFYMTKAKVLAFLHQHGFVTTMRNTGNRVVDDYIYAHKVQL
ncbi:MAG: FkbM family methyltransferase [Bacteroidia bacterium]|nr:FkbM family methyltransferase [Bacteroidia bacterium]